MFRIHCKKEPCVCLEWVQKYSSFADRLSSVVSKAAVKKIFVDETLIQIDGQKYCDCG
jgi:transposase-like protein